MDAPLCVGTPLPRVRGAHGGLLLAVGQGMALPGHMGGGGHLSREPLTHSPECP